MKKLLSMKEFNDLADAYFGGRPKKEKMYSENEVFKMTLDALDLGMTIRQNQLNRLVLKSGKELHKEWFEEIK